MFLNPNLSRFVPIENNRGNQEQQKLLLSSDSNTFLLSWMDNPSEEDSINHYLSKKCISLDKLKEFTRRNESSILTYY